MPPENEDFNDIQNLLKETASEVEQENKEDESAAVSDIFTDFDFDEGEDEEFLEDVMPFDEALLLQKQQKEIPRWVIIFAISLSSVIIIMCAYFYGFKTLMHNYFYRQAVEKLKTNLSPGKSIEYAAAFGTSEFETYLKFASEAWEDNNIDAAVYYLGRAKYGSFREYVSSINDIERIPLKRSQKRKVLNLETKIEISKGKYRDAIDLCNLIKSSLGDVPEMYYNLGIISLRKDENKKALDHFEKVVLLDPNDPNAYIQLRRLYLKFNRPDKAYVIQMRLDSLKNAPAHNAETLAAFGQIFFSKGAYELARDYLTKSIAMDSQQPAPYLMMAEIYVKREQSLKSVDYEKAIEYYLKYLKLNPIDAKINAEVGKLFYKRDKIKESVFYLQKSIDLDSNLGIAHYYIGNIHLYEFNSYKQAIKEYELAKRLNYKDVALDFSLAKAYYYNYDYDKSLELWKKLLNDTTVSEKIGVSTNDIKFNMATTYLFNRDYSDAIQYYDAILRAKDTNLNYAQWLVSVMNNKAISIELNFQKGYMQENDLENSADFRKLIGNNFIMRIGTNRYKWNYNKISLSPRQEKILVLKNLGIKDSFNIVDLKPGYVSKDEIKSKTDYNILLENELITLDKRFAGFVYWVGVYPYKGNYKTLMENKLSEMIKKIKVSEPEKIVELWRKTNEEYAVSTIWDAINFQESFHNKDIAIPESILLKANFKRLIADEKITNLKDYTDWHLRPFRKL